MSHQPSSAQPGGLKQVAEVGLLTVKGRIAAATCHITLRMSTARAIFSIRYSEPGELPPPNAPCPGRTRAPAQGTLPIAPSRFHISNQGLFEGIFRGAQFFEVLPSHPLGVGALGVGPLESSWGVWGSAVSSSGRVWGKAPPDNDFCAI